MRRTIGVFGATVLVLVLIGQSALAQWTQREVNVNGRWLGPADLAVADQAVGFELPNGFYWYDPRTCTWGLIGEQQPRGQVPCRSNPGGGGGPRISPFTPPTCDEQGCFIGHDY
jgi:hypothetical protein